MKLILLLALSVAFASACSASNYAPLDATARAPAAVGAVHLEKGPNDNTIGSLDVKYLAPPEKLRSDLAVYVVWTRPVGSREWQNVGQLVVHDDRTGSVKITVPYGTFELSISAESTGQVSEPSDLVVLQGKVEASS